VKNPVYGPTFEEMLHPDRIKRDVRDRALRAAKENPLDPINLYNITWRSPEGRIYHVVLPREFTGIEANVVVLYSKDFPTGSHKVGATYSVAVEHQLAGDIEPGVHTLVWPSTGNYGIGGAWVGPRMGYDSLVVLPELMSRERFEKIESYGARYVKTPGCESNVKEIYDKTKELRRDPKIRILNQFEEFGNYRFHYHVTGSACLEVAKDLAGRGIAHIQLNLRPKDQVPVFERQRHHAFRGQRGHNVVSVQIQHVRHRGGLGGRSGQGRGRASRKPYRPRHRGRGTVRRVRR
jgi:hypothetical protein